MIPRLHTRESSPFIVEILHVLDCLIVVGILWLLANAYTIESWSEYYTYLALTSFVLSFFCFHSVKLYRPWRGVLFYKEFLVILKAWGLFVGAILSLIFMFKVGDDFSRVVIISWFVSCPLAIFLVHLMMRKILAALRAHGRNLRFAVIVGAGHLGQYFASYLESIPWAGIKVVGFFDDHKTSKDFPDGNRRVLGTVSELADYLKDKKHIVDYVYIALPLRSETKIISILNECRTLGAQIYMVPDLFTFSIFNADFQTLGDLLLINFNPEYRWKRYFDIVFASLALLITLPLNLLIALLIKLQDGGPVFYGHQRITLAGKTFTCWKFRTMAVDADRRLQELLDRDPRAWKEWQKTFKLKNDPRVTKIGRFLRRKSLDELPQFFNILKGDMSVVGARPIIKDELRDYYKGNAGLYCSLKPGITGPWQVELRSDTADYQERVDKDLWYLQNLSFWLDLKIIFKTIFVVFLGKGAC